MGKSIEVNNTNHKNIIIVPVFGQLDKTRAMLQTIGTIPNTSLLIISNGNPRMEAEELKTLAENKGDFFIAYPENIGVASAWNVGVKLGFDELGCDKALILNSDILLQPNTLPRILDDLDGENIGLVSSRDISPECIDEEDFFNKKMPSLPRYKEEPDFSCFGINRKCYETVGLFDDGFYPAYYEDNDYHYRMRLVGLNAVKNINNYHFHYVSQSLRIDEKQGMWFGYRCGMNKERYKQKWGGYPEEETYRIPFNGETPPEPDREPYSIFLKKALRPNSEGTA